MRWRQYTVQYTTVVLCLPVVIDNIQGKLSLRLSGVSRESVVSGVFGETLRLTGGRPADVWRNFSKIFLIRQLTWLAPVWRRRLPTHLLKTTLGVRICCESGGGEWSCPACRRCRDRRDTCRASPRCGSSGGWRDGPTCHVYPAFLLVQRLHYCALIGRELQSGEIFSCTERSYYRRSLWCYASNLLP